MSAPSLNKTLAVFATALVCVLGTGTATALTQPVSARQSLIRALITRAARTAEPAAQATIGSLEAVAAMTPCSTEPDVQLYGRGTYRDARVSCASQGWQLYIPVTLQAEQKIVVAAHDLRSGVVLNTADLKLVDATAVGGTADPTAHDMQAVVGQTLLAPVSAGTPIALAGLQQAELVHAGQAISVLVRSGPVRIKTTAVALQAGRPGQSILVKNPYTGYRYRAEVGAHGAEVDLTW